MVTDPVEVRRLAKEKEAENLAFRRYLHDHHCSGETFHVIAAEVENEIDCKQCANCCRQTVVSVSAAEIENIARYLQVDRADVVTTYLTADPRFPHELFLKNSGAGCVFLDGNLCMIYEARPRVCREFPHLSGVKHSPATAMDAVCRRSAICPIVYNALEKYKHQIGFHRNSGPETQASPDPNREGDSIP